MNQTARRTQTIAIIGMIILIVAIPFTIAAINLFLDISSQADPQKTPVEVVISNKSESSVTISWVTELDSEGLVQYGTSEDSLNLVGNDLRDLGGDSLNGYKTHIVTLRNLSPSTEYFYKILSDGEEYVEGTGSFQTFAVESSVGVPKTLKGSVGSSSPYALVYTYATNNRTRSEIRSTYTSANGTFTFDIANLRTEDGSSTMPTEGVKLVTYVNASDLGKIRKIHDVDEDPGDLSLGTEDIAFDYNVQVTLDDVADDTGGDTTPTPTPTTPKPSTTTPTITANRVSLVDPTIPENIFVSNINTTSFTVNWITKQPTSGYLTYGETSTSLSKAVLDIRDSSKDIERFTHSVKVTKSDLEAGDILYYKIVSEEKSYGSSGTTGSSAYEFEAPAILDSPPTPDAVTGILNYLSGSRLSNEKRDFIIYGRLEDANANVSSYISTVPAYESNGWTLALNARKADLSDSFDDATEIGLEVVGEYNSNSSRNVTISEDTVQIAVNPGLSLDTLRHNESYPTVTKLAGTATPNASVKVTIDGSNDTIAATADSTGEWESGAVSFDQDTYIIGVSDSNQAMTLSFVVDLSALPATGLGRNEMIIIAGIALVVLGIGLRYWGVKQKVLT
ncbi:fibronectin type III domain-containing protein [Candidatus Dojkabacteria bacterium]|nr:fibronectin type III domain-containing protein [Candidatus Dojkabacteria bacterium]